MSGFGERFRRDGYAVPKPLIEIDGKPIIAHVIDMFPGETDFIFICNQDHLANSKYRMKNILNHYCPTGKIVGIAPHKLGPMHAVQQVEHLIDKSRPVVVNYCDFTCYWDWHHFKNFVAANKCYGAIPAYKGFHPHSLGTTNYAYVREKNGWATDIQEKLPFTNDRMNEFASSGTYYFSTGSIMFEAFSKTIEKKQSISGEYYISLAYKSIFEQNERVAVYPLQHFMQWGTPEDVQEYNGWSNLFKRLIAKANFQEFPRGTVMIPMAGLGQRFVNEGYTETKPLIPVSGKPMVMQAINDLPKSAQYVFVLRSDMLGVKEITQTLKEAYANSIIKKIPNVTDGQARTCSFGLGGLKKEVNAIEDPITFGACDNGALYNKSSFKEISEREDIDVIVWGVRGHPNAIRHPHMYGWIDANEDGLIKNVSVKKPLECPRSDPIVIGTFTFKRAADFEKVTKSLFDRDGRINGEFYIDSCINDAVEMGLKCYVFEVDHFISWGTPNDLRTFEYWQSCFHKWKSHPYRLELDFSVAKQNLETLDKKYGAAN
jgi:NDP-sugar pyrophosphorylase family protein